MTGTRLSEVVVVIGEALMDIVRRDGVVIHEAPGGSPANVSLAVARLGASSHLLTAFGDDDHGSRIREWLDEAGVETCRTRLDRTGTAVADLGPDGSATYEFDLCWKLSQPPIDDIDPGIVHAGSIAAILPPGSTQVQEMLASARAHSLTTYDPNVRPALLPDHAGAVRDVEDMVSSADVVKASDDDLRWLYPERSPLRSASEWLARGPALVVVTGGGEGATAVTSAFTVTSEARRVDVVDTVGAGDAFMGALIVALLRRGYANAAARDRLRAVGAGEIRELLEFATDAAAITVSRPGADPPFQDEMTAASSRSGLI
ncbi:carbohydrate kinase family protein [Microbacterium saperdae]|uniref:Fructokinase n=1 Tax=Microbacterium saperdae TaxID=69368 RepID=A0A543BAR4_9MICO|nr:carbohydrate kinase [Microbacterium saperdae]TQL81918.1 fructokinase [Microbacterium saperdae]GGM35746.1 fructokinase [Microbacterium saperdae]